jgi:hypothetical protein
MMHKFPPTAAAVPEGPLRDHAVKVEALIYRLIHMLNASGETPDVILNALINVYMNAGSSYGRELECANAMALIAGQVLLKDARQKQAAGVDPAAPPTRH